MNLLNTNLRFFLLSLSGLLIVSCTRTEDNLGEENACELYLKGLSYECVDNTCSYIATIENNGGNGQFDLEVNQATYDHYKALAEKQQANICWEGEIE